MESLLNLFFFFKAPTDSDSAGATKDLLKPDLTVYTVSSRTPHGLKTDFQSAALLSKRLNILIPAVLAPDEGTQEKNDPNF